MESLAGIGSFIREQREAAEVSLRQLAKLAGVSNPYLSQVERGLRKPSAEILQQIARGLSVSAETLYAQAGLMSEEAGQKFVVEALRHDPLLTAEQRQALITTYLSFVSANQTAESTKESK